MEQHTDKRLGYLKECREIARQHQKGGDKVTPDEFLSGLHRDDRLHPIISIVSITMKNRGMARRA